jgi:hypothetical protein
MSCYGAKAGLEGADMSKDKGKKEVKKPKQVKQVK